MNFYNPYYGYIPYTAYNVTNRGLLSRIFPNGINFSAILSNTQKTLNIINQGIPVIKQISPIMRNAKTMFKVLNEFKKEDTLKNVSTKINNNKSTNIESNSKSEIPTINNNGPTFYV